MDRLHRQEVTAGRGRLKLFLGFAAGVGKTYEMLNEANRRKHERNQDVVVGYIETHGRKGTIEQIGDLEIVPRKKIIYRGSEFEEMDADAVIARMPQWVIVDELAHTNIPGSKHAKRYEDVLDFLHAGINVLSTMNVQHLESLNDTVARITGVTVRETVPDTVLAEVDEIKSIDISPRTLINRLQRGDVYPSEKVPAALANFFTEGNLSALRELALREVAAEVERSVQTYRTEHGVSEQWQTTERVMVCLSPYSASDRLLRRGWRIASRLNADIISVYVVASKSTPEQKKMLDADFALAKTLNIPVNELEGRDVAQALAGFARDNQVTEIVMGHSARTAWQEFWHGSIIKKLIPMVRGIDVLVVALPD